MLDSDFVYFCSGYDIRGLNQGCDCDLCESWLLLSAGTNWGFCQTIKCIGLCCDWSASLKVVAANGRTAQGNSDMSLHHPPFFCRALAQPLSHIFLFWRALSVCPPIGRGVRGRPSTKAAGARGRGYGLTFHRPLSRFVYRTLSFLSSHERETSEKNTADREGREARGLFHLSAGPGGGVFVKVFRLVREELRWGSVWQAGCSVGALS